MTARTDVEEQLMTHEPAGFPWIPLTTLSAGLVAYAVTTRVVPAVTRLALARLGTRRG